MGRLEEPKPLRPFGHGSPELRLTGLMGSFFPSLVCELTKAPTELTDTGISLKIQAG